MDKIRNKYQIFKTNLGYPVKLSKISNGIYISNHGVVLMSIRTFNQKYGHDLNSTQTARRLTQNDVVNIAVPVNETENLYKKEKAFPLEELEKCI